MSVSRGVLTMIGLMVGGRAAVADPSCGIAIVGGAIDAGCLPALAADRKAVLVPVIDPDGGRGNPNLAVRVLPVARGGAARTLPVITAAEWDQGGDAERTSTAAPRIAAIDRALAAGFTRVLIALPPAGGDERQALHTTVADLELASRDGALALTRPGAGRVKLAFPASKVRGACRGVNTRFVGAVYRDDNIVVVRFDARGNDRCPEPAAEWAVVTVGAATPAARPGAAPITAPPSPADSKAADQLWLREAFGPLQIGMTAKQLTAELGKPKQKTAIEKEEATGAWVTTWDYDGVSVVLSARSKAGKQTISALTLRAPSKFTGRGVGVGASVAELARAYPRELWDKESTTDERVVVGSIYGGIIFTLADHKVTEIFVGAGAE